jgi:branched-chain amino acid transport system ATP-binding protein
MSEPLLHLEGVFAGYGSLAVVRDLSFDVSPGEVVVLLGPNGAGKTTTVLTVASFLPMLGGTVRIMGEAPPPIRRAHHSIRRGLGVVLDNRGLFTNLTVREHIRLVASRAEATSSLEFVLGHIPELNDLLDRKVGLLSGGEQQMLAVGRALARRPKLLVIDEMSMGLAPLIAARLGAVVRDLADKEGVGVLVVEQHLDLALSIGDRAVVLEHGERSFMGPVAELTASRDQLVDSYFGRSEDSSNQPSTV